MSDEIYACTESETRAKRAWAPVAPKLIASHEFTSGDDIRQSVTSLLPQPST